MSVHSTHHGHLLKLRVCKTTFKHVTTTLNFISIEKNSVKVPHIDVLACKLSLRLLLTTAVLLGAVFIALRHQYESQPRGDPYRAELAKLAFVPANNSMMKLIITGATGAGMLHVYQLEFQVLLT